MGITVADQGETLTLGNKSDDDGVADAEISDADLLPLRLPSTSATNYRCIEKIGQPRPLNPHLSHAAAPQANAPV